MSRKRCASEGRWRDNEVYGQKLVLHSPVAMVVAQGPDHKNVLLVNRKFTELFGYSLKDMPDQDHWWPLAYPDEAYRNAIRAEWVRRVERALAHNTEIEPMEASVRCKDGSTRQIEFHFAKLGDTSLVSFVDLTDRYRANLALRESEARFRLVANTAPVMIWMSGLDKLCNYFNQPWLEFTGRPLEAELGNGWAKEVHPEDVKICLDTYTQAFDRRESFHMQYRLRRYDGEYRWLFDIGVPRFEPDGSFAGYIGSCFDVTEQKLAQEALANVGRRLIEAQEQERTWIARELHDDINQRLALLASELEQCRDDVSKSAVDLRVHIHHACQCVTEIGNDIQALSHRLHSSKLEYLGIVNATKSFCMELSEQHKVHVEFTYTDIPRHVPSDISLALFRIVQEALQNAVKHSRTKAFKVHMWSAEDKIHLTVIDRGSGFDPGMAMNGRGLGLISMRERLHLVGGELSIKSEPNRGTMVSARVPSRRKESSAQIAE